MYQIMLYNILYTILFYFLFNYIAIYVDFLTEFDTSFVPSQSFVYQYVSIEQKYTYCIYLPRILRVEISPIHVPLMLFMFDYIIIHIIKQLLNFSQGRINVYSQHI